MHRKSVIFLTRSLFHSSQTLKPSLMKKTYILTIASQVSHILIWNIMNLFYLNQKELHAAICRNYEINFLDMISMFKLLVKHTICQPVWGIQLRHTYLGMITLFFFFLYLLFFVRQENICLIMVFQRTARIFH